ncbi:Zn(II)2Cys6 transcription factor [Aspergillus undulatus]|uniref:Zn(II)2Cys6 transcription factor n=1 Tax=Aspergillus undulatus TaxID=1810928 RepID=UPI003CCD2253
MAEMDNASPNIERQEIDRVLILKRKQRESKACYPCRQRKVKCEGGHPCRTCARRDHPEICAYNVEQSPARKRVSIRPRDQETVSRGSGDDTAALTSPTHSVGAEVSQPPTSSLGDARSSVQPNDNPSYVFSGDNSLVSMLRQQDPDGAMAREATSVLGLHNTYPSYPFIETKKPQDRWAALLDILPHRDEVLKFFHFYRISAYPFNPILVDVDQFESDICVYLSAYASGELRDRNKISDKWASGKSVGQISLLLATLAAGAHFSDLENPQRSELCQDFAHRSFQALRLANFLFRPSLEAVQSLLILGNTLQNNGQSDSAWALLGTTVRLAQTLGLHTERGIAHWPEHSKLNAKSLWSMTVWQDSLLSLCYDRPPIVSTRGWNPEARSMRTELSYLNLMQYLCWIALSIMQIDDPPESEPTQNLALLAELDSTYSRAQSHLLRRQDCKNLQQHLEHLALRMHVSFCVSALCRPAIRSSPQTLQDTCYLSLRSRAKESLIIASKTFLDFQALSIVPLRTWSMVHTVLSSTLLLSTWQETKEDPECRDLQQKVIEVFSAGNSEKDTGSSGYSQWLSARHIKALITLRQALKQRSAPSLGPKCGLDMGHGQIAENATNYGVSDVPQDMPWMGDSSSYNDLFPGLYYGFSGGNGMDFSPVTYLDSIMNVPLFNFSEG